MAASYDSMAPYLVPDYGYFQQCIVDQLRLSCTSEPRVVDIGAGSGRLLEQIFISFPESRCVWIDYSPDFKSVAQTRLASFEDRITYLERSFTDPWEEQIPFRPNCIVSSNSIHHLSNRNKRLLYSRCHHALLPGGWFFNHDEMKTLYDDSYFESMRFWVEHVDAARSSIPEELEDDYEAWTDKFDRWKERNLSPGQKREGDDIHESFLKQLKWLHRSGFELVDLYAKRSLWSMIGGRRRQDPL